MNVDAELAKLAAVLKAKYNLPYADCFGGALAKLRRATFVTSDKDFKLVERHLDILWTTA